MRFRVDIGCGHGIDPVSVEAEPMRMVMVATCATCGQKREYTYHQLVEAEALPRA